MKYLLALFFFWTVVSGQRTVLIGNELIQGLKPHLRNQTVECYAQQGAILDELPQTTSIPGQLYVLRNVSDYPIHTVIMNGGFMDLFDPVWGCTTWDFNCRTIVNYKCESIGLFMYFMKMSGVERVIYMDGVSPPHTEYLNPATKDFMNQVESICTPDSDPSCYFVDLRPLHYYYPLSSDNYKEILQLLDQIDMP